MKYAKVQPRKHTNLARQPYKTASKYSTRNVLFGFAFLALSIVVIKVTLPHNTAHVSAAVVASVHSSAPHQSVCIDPGHGGDDPGAQANNLTESTLNLQVAFIVRTKLEAKGYPVYMTRTTDKTLSHAQRAEFCNAHHASILVAIHQNDYPYGNADYSTALYYKPQDLALAAAMANAAGKELGLSVSPPSYFVGGVLMHSTMPATLIESLFITNTSEAKALTNGNRINEQAQGIVNGINDYLHTHSQPQTSTSKP